MTKELHDLIARADVVSFDVFDTLLVRTYLKPTDLFRRMEEESGLVGFAEARRRADYESVIRAVQQGKDATIDDAYAILPAQFQGLQARELALEREGLTANADLVSVWETAGALGKRRVIASDMYLPRSFLEEVLRTNGIDGWDGFYLSCDCGARKSSGRMYELILRDLGVAAERLLHVGDNPESDVAIPRRLGISAYQVEKTMESVCGTNPFLQRFLMADDSLTARRLVASVCVAWRRYSAEHPNPPYWARVGGFLGGVMGAAYVAFLVREVRARKVDRLLFVARDGYALEKMFNAVAPDIGTNFVYAPRSVRYSSDPRLHAEYDAYVRGLCIGADESVGVVDTVSLHYSAQKMIATALGRPVCGFAFLAFAKPECGAEFLLTPHVSLRWYSLAEQLFMTNEPPVEAVVDGLPVHKTPVPEEERTRMAVFSEAVEAEIAVAKFLLECEIAITPVRLLDFVDAFLDSMTEEDGRRFAAVKNNVDPKTGEYVPILHPPHWTSQWQTFLGIPVFRRHYGREGLKIVLRDRLLGLYEFRKTEESL